MPASIFLYKFVRFEYWPWWLFYLPMTPYFLYQAVRTRSLTFMTGVNPGIYGGGFYGEKKTDILQHIPEEYLPTTVFISANSPFSEIMHLFDNNRLTYPIIAKPNVGERGTDVEKIENEPQLLRYANRIEADFLLQEFVSHPVELGVLYSRLPNEAGGNVSSVTLKEFLTVTGDGISSIEALILQKPRAAFQLPDLQKRLGVELQNVLASGENHLLEPIGNHCRGTKFLNANHILNENLDAVFDKISQPYAGFFYGRYDLKVSSFADLEQGKNIRIMELNGVSADPAHVFDPDYKLIAAYRDLAWHWNRMADIYMQNKRRGIDAMPLREVWQIIKSTFFT